MTELLDSMLSTWEHREHHTRRIQAPPEQVWDALTNLRVSDLRISMALIRLRGGPTAWLRGVQAPPGMRAIDAFAPKPVVENPPHEIVLADIASYTGNTASRPDIPRGDIAAFSGFSDPGWSKVVMNFHLTRTDTGTLLATETRVHSTDPATRRTFHRYWLLVRAGSGLIRHDLLSSIDRTTG